MFEYLVEAYCCPTGREGAGPSPERIARVAAEVTLEGQPVRLVRTVVVPDDEMCFYFFEAASEEAVVEVAKRSGLRFEHFVEAESKGVAAAE